MNPVLTFIAGALLSTAAATTRAEPVSIAWSDAGTFMHQTQIAAGKFVEVCGPLRAGSKVDWWFEAGGPIDFNVHYHQGKEVFFPAKISRVTHAKDSLQVEVKQDYCWMWTNTTAAAVELKVGFQR